MLLLLLLLLINRGVVNVRVSSPVRSSTSDSSMMTTTATAIRTE